MMFLNLILFFTYLSHSKYYCGCPYTIDLNNWQSRGYSNSIEYYTQCDTSSKSSYIQFGINKVMQLYTPHALCLRSIPLHKININRIKKSQQVTCDNCEKEKYYLSKQTNNKPICNCQDLQIKLVNMTFDSETCLTYEINIDNYDCPFYLNQVIIGINDGCPTVAPTNKPTYPYSWHKPPTYNWYNNKWNKYNKKSSWKWSPSWSSSSSDDFKWNNYWGFDGGKYPHRRRRRMFESRITYISDGGMIVGLNDNNIGGPANTNNYYGNSYSQNIRYKAQSLYTKSMKGNYDMSTGIDFNGIKWDIYGSKNVTFCVDTSVNINKGQFAYIHDKSNGNKKKQLTWNKPIKCVLKEGPEICENGSKFPSMMPTNMPSKQPTNEPTNVPTINPIVIGPTISPTNVPSMNPTEIPTNQPSMNPTKIPTNNPSVTPTNMPSDNPTEMPTNQPSMNPTNNPSMNPTEIPTEMPSNNPTEIPTNQPSNNPTNIPTMNPTQIPTNIPTAQPSNNPTDMPSAQPTAIPTNIPTISPTVNCSGILADSDQVCFEAGCCACDNSICTNIINNQCQIVDNSTTNCNQAPRRRNLMKGFRWQNSNFKGGNGYTCEEECSMKPTSVEILLEPFYNNDYLDINGYVFEINTNTLECSFAVNDFCKQNNYNNIVINSFINTDECYDNNYYYNADNEIDKVLIRGNKNELVYQIINGKYLIILPKKARIDDNTISNIDVRLYNNFVDFYVPPFNHVVYQCLVYVLQ